IRPVGHQNSPHEYTTVCPESCISVPSVLPKSMPTAMMPCSARGTCRLDRARLAERVRPPRPDADQPRPDQAEAVEPGPDLGRGVPGHLRGVAVGVLQGPDQ